MCATSAASARTQQKSAAGVKYRFVLSRLANPPGFLYILPSPEMASQPPGILENDYVLSKMDYPFSKKLLGVG